MAATASLTIIVYMSESISCRVRGYSGAAPPRPLRLCSWASPSGLRAPGGDRRGDGLEKRFAIDGLAQVALRAAAQRPGAGLAAVVPRDHDDRDTGVRGRHRTL